MATLLRNDGYWVHASHRIELAREQERALQRPSMPRSEIDLVAYKGLKNEVLAMECKSFLDSTGVMCSSVTDSNSQAYRRYNLFNEPEYWRTVT